MQDIIELDKLNAVNSSLVAIIKSYCINEAEHSSELVNLIPLLEIIYKNQNELEKRLDNLMLTY